MIFILTMIEDMTYYHNDIVTTKRKPL